MPVLQPADEVIGVGIQFCNREDDYLLGLRLAASAKNGKGNVRLITLATSSSKFTKRFVSSVREIAEQHRKRARAERLTYREIGPLILTALADLMDAEGVTASRAIADAQEELMHKQPRAQASARPSKLTVQTAVQGTEYLLARQDKYIGELLEAHRHGNRLILEAVLLRGDAALIKLVEDIIYAVETQKLS